METEAPKTKFSIFEDVFEEHEDIQKDRRATLLGTRLDGISEGEESSRGSHGSRRSTVSSKSTAGEDEESTENSRRESMDSLQGVGDLSSICCEEDEESRRWSNHSMMNMAESASTPAVVELPSSGGFSIFMED